jgi:nucleoside-diphosphate-sugar epimerase
MHVSIIGNGFIGGAIAKFLEFKKIPYACLNSQKFNLCQSETWGWLPTNTEIVVLAAGKFSEHIDELENVNVKPIRSLCGFFQNRKVRKFILLSTGAVYGDYEEDTSPESICNPTSKYGKSKLEAENLILKNWDFDLNILRLFFPYGPKQNLPRLIPNLIKKIEDGTPIQINQYGGPFLSLTHVDDLAEVIVEDFVCVKNTQIINNLSSSYRINIRGLSIELSKFIGKDPIFEILENNFSNYTSIPYNFLWKKSGSFQDLFNEV